MKKTVLLTVLILSFVFSIAPYAAVVETSGYMFIEPDAYYSNSTSGNLPTAADRMTSINKGSRFFTVAESGSSAVAALENDSSTNVVFKISGSAGLADRISVAAKNTGAVDNSKMPLPVRRHSAKISLSSVNVGTTALHVIAPSPAGNALALKKNGSGVYLSNGGAYINNAVSGEKIWFVSPETMSADTWYTVETVVEILDAGYVTQDARIYAADGTLVGRSGYYRVEDDSTLTASVTMSQIYTEGFTTETTMIDEWQVYGLSGMPAKVSFTTDFSDNSASRKVYKLVSDTALDANSVSTDAVKLTSTTVDMTGKYTVSYDSATQAIVVTASDSLPYNTNFVIQLAAEKMLASADKYLALDYSNATLEYSFTTPLDPFDISSINYDPATGTATVNVQNNDAVPRDCMVIVASFGADDEYMGTRCGFANVSNVAGSNTATITVTGIEKAAGGRVSVMVWDNWKTMSSIGNMHTVNISAE